MYTYPNSTIKIMRGVNISPNYADTLWFNSLTEQTGFFSSAAVYTLQNYSYIRQDNAVKVELSTAQLLGCNYMSFNNLSYEGKWFYAFIDRIEYINDNTSKIYFTIDEIQSWLFAYELDQVQYIERNTHPTDDLFASRTPEQLETGEYIVNDKTSTSWKQKICIAATFDASYENSVGTDIKAPSGGWLGDMYEGLTYHFFNTSDSARQFIQGAVEAGKSSGIVGITMLPDEAATMTPQIHGVSAAINTKKINGYKPRNNKLFNYPYNFLFVTDFNGTSAKYFYELFADSTTASFDYFAVPSLNPQVSLYPKNYGETNPSEDEPQNANAMLRFGGWPPCSWSTDAFKAWIAQNVGSLVASGANLAINFAGALTGGIKDLVSGTAAAYATGGAMGGDKAASGVSGITNGTVGTLQSAISMAGNIYDHYIQPPINYGSSVNTPDFILRGKNIYFLNITITKEYAAIIDDFFSRFGYAVNSVGIPNINVRPVYNYVKTLRAAIKGNMPEDSRRVWNRAFDNGITFWKNNSQVGDYKLENK